MLTIGAAVIMLLTYFVKRWTNMNTLFAECFLPDGSFLKGEIVYNGPDGYVNTGKGTIPLSDVKVIKYVSGSSDFVKEDRYILIKKSDAENTFSELEWEVLNKLLSKIKYSRMSNGKLPLEAVVVESDWPEYEKVWGMIKDHMKSKWDWCD